MAHIKCRYRKPICTYSGAEYMNPNDGLDCNDKYSGCQHYCEPVDFFNGICVKDDTDDSVCVHYSVEYNEFEKNYKEYVFDGSGLSLGRRGFIPHVYIDYLEIDGRILINEEVNK